MQCLCVSTLPPMWATIRFLKITVLLKIFKIKKKGKIACTEISKMLSEKYEIPFSITEWLRKQFDSVHTNIFKGYPFIKVNEDKLEVIINA